MPSGKSVDVPEGTTLLAAIQQAEEKFAQGVQGDALYEKSHVFVQEGRKGLSKVSREENEKLDAIVGVGSKSRLASLATVLGTENIVVELLGFDSGF
jgi:2Fe-2S ferredoxin